MSLLAGAALLLAAFVAVERRVAEPMLPLGLFKRRAFTGVQLAAFAVSVSLFALFLYLTLYLQDYLHYSPLQAGLRYLPITIGSFVAAPIAGALLSRVHARVLMALGLLGTGVGLILMSGLNADSGWTALLPGFIAAGLGVGLLNPVIADVALSVVPKERSGMAVGDQRHVPAGRGRRGRRGLGSDLPRPWLEQVSNLARGHPGERPRPPAPATGGTHRAVT